MGECHAGSSRDAMTPLAPLLVSSGRCSGWGSHGRSKAGEEGEGVRAERGRRTQEHKRDRVCEKKCRSPACASHGGQNRPWTLRFHTQVSQRETISSLRIRWAEGGGRPQNTKEDFTCEEPPRRPVPVWENREKVLTAPCTLAESSGRAPRWTNLQQDHEHLLEVTRGVPNDVSLQVSLVGCGEGTQALVPSPGHPRKPG